MESEVSQHVSFFLKWNELFELLSKSKGADMVHFSATTFSNGVVNITILNADKLLNHGFPIIGAEGNV